MEYRCESVVDGSFYSEDVNDLTLIAWSLVGML